MTPQVTDQVERLLALLGNRPMTVAEIMRGLEMNHRPTLRDNYLHPALQAGPIEMTVPDKPNSRLQKYRLTEKGKRRFLCAHATTHEKQHGGKPWTYLLIPHDVITDNKTLQGLAATYTYGGASSGKR